MSSAGFLPFRINWQSIFHRGGARVESIVKESGAFDADATNRQFGNSAGDRHPSQQCNMLAPLCRALLTLSLRNLFTIKMLANTSHFYKGGIAYIAGIHNA